jgi:LmbE family N-acetylglucosaminyl deacetylase
MYLVGKTSNRPKLLGLFAHPDDETFCAGGTLAKFAAAGWETMVVSATRGQAGQIHDARVATRRTLGQVRERELRSACAHLGVQHVRCFDYMDGSLEQSDRHELIGRVVATIRDFRPDVVITFGADGAYGHPDHIAMSSITTEAWSVAADSTRFPEQLAAGLAPHRPTSLYHSHFPRSRLLLLDWLAHWVAERGTRFKGTTDFVHALSLFAQESTMLRCAGDHIEVRWFPARCSIIEQGEPGTSLYLILSGSAEVVQEAIDGSVHPLAQLDVGEFFGEMALVRGHPRTAHVIAVDNVTCLVFSPSAPTAFAGRGADAQATGTVHASGTPEVGATTCIDVSEFVEQKILAVAAHRTQYPITPDMFPLPMLREMLGREYFVRICPQIEYETELLTARDQSALYQFSTPEREYAS